VASLFAGRSHDRVADIDDDHDLKEDDSERGSKSDKNDSLKNSIKSRKAF
jgi:hypothetical protein